MNALSVELVSDASKSTLTFSFTQAGGTNTGKFGKFDVRLSEPGGAIVGGALTVSIDAPSIDTYDQERDDILRGADLFDTKQFPVAGFAAQNIESAGDERYRTVGTLTMRDKSRPMDLPLTARHVTESGIEVTYLEGEVSIDRLDYGVGQREWRSTEWVDNKVTIAWSIRLVPSQ